MLVPALSSCLLPFSSAPSHRACRVRIGGTRRQCVQGADPQVGWNGISEEISSRSKSRNLSAKSKAQTKADFSSVQLNNDTSIKRGTKMILQIAAVAKMVASY